MPGKPKVGTGVRILAELRRREVRLEVVGDKLQFHPIGNTTKRLREEIGRYKGEIMALLMAERRHEASGQKPGDTPIEVRTFDEPKEIMNRYELEIKRPKGKDVEPRTLSSWWKQDAIRRKKLKVAEARLEAEQARIKAEQKETT